MIAEAVAEATAPLIERIAKLEAELARAKKNSSNSSKPPSGDMVKPPKPPVKNRKRRKRGGQPGHERRLRRPFSPEDVNHIEPYTLDCCPDCGGSLRLSRRSPDVLQQVEITETPTVVTEHRGLAYWCPHLRAALRELFAVIHRRDKLTAVGFQRALESARRAVLKVATSRVPKGNHAQNLAKRFREHGEAYFRFVTTPGVEPTNNLAEQAIRFVVIDRRVTLGTRSETGRRWCERIWTVIATRAQQGRSVFKFLMDSIHAYFCGGISPSLMPSGP